MPKYYLVGVSHPLSFELSPGYNTVGRNPTNDVRIRDVTVSSFHCEIVLEHDSILVRDLGSSNGTFLGDERIKEGKWTKESTLRLGNCELKLEQRADAEPVRVSVPPLAPMPAAPAPALADGLPGCDFHTTTHAFYRCTACKKAFCTDCVRILRVADGPERVFCPACSGACDPLNVPVDTPRVQSRKPASLLGRLSQTIHIRR